MAKIRLEISKDEAIRYISHLDYARAVERSVLRAKLPVAYSEGFNPHMKISFASALAVGVTSAFEYVDIEFKTDMLPAAVVTALQPVLPNGIRVLQAVALPERMPALMAVVNLATYEVVVPLADGGTVAAVEAALAAFAAAETVTYTKVSPKGSKDIDVKQFIAKPVTAVVKGSQVELAMTIHITPRGSVKPGEVLAALIGSYALPVVKDSALIHRSGLFIADETACRTPMAV